MNAEEALAAIDGAKKKARKRRRRRRMIREDKKEIELINGMTKEVDGGRIRTLIQ